MKTHIGNRIGFSINLGNYETLKVESVFEIDKDLNEDEIEDTYNKISNVIKKDLEKKVKEYNLYKKHLKRMIKDI